jgi:PBSX family phage terminase large subunit
MSHSYPQLRDAVFKTFCEEIKEYQETLDENKISVTLMTHTVSPGKMDISFYNGSEIMFRSCDNEEKIRGITLDWFELDEPIRMKEDVFKQCMARISGKRMPFNFGLLATNPGAENHWIYRNFYNEKRERFFTVETNVYENIMLPHYVEYIKDLETNYDVDWTRRFLQGKWGAFAGQIYKMFDPESENPDQKTVVRPLKLIAFNNIDKYYAGVDSGIRDPTCILVIMQTKENYIYVVEEYYETEKTSYECAIKLAELNKKYNFTKVYCDPSAADLITQAYERGVPIGKFDNGQVKSFANNDVKPGIAKLQSVFKNKKIVIDSSCINLIRSLLGYRYKNDGETPLKEDDHACDALRYGVTDYSPFNDDFEFGCGKFITKFGRLMRSK